MQTGYRHENQFWNLGFTNGATEFCWNQHFCYKILFYLVSSYFTIFFDLLNQNLQIIRPQKGNYKEFRSTISFKFLALGIWNLQSIMHLESTEYNAFGIYRVQCTWTVYRGGVDGGPGPTLSPSKEIHDVK